VLTLPSQNECGTGTIMVLFTPSPKSYYRVQQFTDLETAKQFCEGYAAVPDVQFYLRLTICDATWHDFSECTRLFETNRTKLQKYMVLCKAMDPCYHEIVQFEKLDEAMQFASEMRTRWEAFRAWSPYPSDYHLPKNISVVAFTLMGEWHVENKPASSAINSRSNPI
jgi:hypothetical protein